MDPTLTFTLIFVATMLLLIAELEHRVVVALLAAVLTSYFGISYGLFKAEDIPHMMELDTLLFIVASLILFQSLEATGLFDFLSFYIVEKLKLGKGGVLSLLLILSTLFSAVCENYIAILVMANVTLYLSKMYDFSPEEPLMVEGVLGNLGGLMLPISSIPGLIVSVKKGIGFLEFIRISSPLIFMLTMVSLLYYRAFLYKESKKSEIREIIPQKEKSVIDQSTVYKSLIIFVMFVVGVAVSEQIGLPITFTAFAFVVLMFMFSGLNPAKVMSRINWEVPFFIGGFAIFVNGLEKAGVLHIIGEYTNVILGLNVEIAVITLVFICGVLSALVENVPVVLLLLPVIDDAIAGMNLSPRSLYWSLIIGSSIGGGLTIYGSIPVLTAASLAEEKGYRITVGAYSKKIAPLVLVHLVVSALYLESLTKLNIL